MYKRFILPVLILLVSGCKCPEALSPTIALNSNSLNEGSLLKLDVAKKEGFKIVWQGPDSTFEGSTWIRNKATGDMSGIYSAKYVNEKREKCFSDSSSTEVTVNLCPKFDDPKISSNATGLYVRDSLVLSVPEISNTTVIWVGPDSTFVGNPWIRKNVQIESSGRYTVKYARLDFEIKCESVCDTINIDVIDPFISEIEYNGVKYFVELILRDKVANVNLRVDKDKTSKEDIINAMTIKIDQVDKKEFAKEICRFTTNVDNSEMIVGCMATAATAGCLVGMAVTGGVATPACAVVISVNNSVGLPACLLGIAGVIAQSISESSAYSTALVNVVSSISSGDFLSATRSAIGFACIDGQGSMPTMSGGEAVVDKAAMDAAAKAAADKAAADKAAADKAAKDKADKAAKDKAAKDKADRADKGGAISGDRGNQGGGDKGSKGGDKGGGDKGGKGGDKGGGDKGDKGGKGGDKGGGDKGGKGGDKGGDKGGKGGGKAGGGLA